VSSRALYRLSPAGDAFFFSLRNPLTGQAIPLQQKYRIGLTDLGAIRPATDSEWESGKELELRRARAVKLQGAEPQTHPVERDDRTLVLNGHVLPKSGDIWMQFMEFRFSLNDTYVALSSFNGWYDAGRASHDGPFFIDVYETAQGKRVALIRGSWCDFTPDGLLADLAWISERDLVFPYGWEKRDMIVCHFD
jgi:hypothetical protein